MATNRSGSWTREETTALRSAVKAKPGVKKTELARRLIKASRLGRGRPPVELTGLAQYARVLKGRTSGAIAAAL